MHTKTNNLITLKKQMFEIKGPGSQEEYFLNACQIISVLSVHASMFLFYFFCLLKRKMDKKFLLASMKTHLLILKIFPKATTEFMFKFNFFLIGNFFLVSIHN
jgi:hypothetical protein